MLYQKQRHFAHSSARLQEKVAVKVLLSKDLDNCDKELKNMIKIGTNTPNIVKFYGSCTLNKGLVGLVMELFDTDLMQYIDENPCSFFVTKLTILGQVANGLKHLKELKIVHRDVKPDNILVKTDGNGEIQVALTDLGISKHMTETQRSRQTNIGTDLWMAPEVRGDKPTYGHPADVYGFGLTAIYILTGNFPLGRNVKRDELSQWVNKCLQGQDGEFSNLIRRCLKYDPSKRISKNAIIDHGQFHALK